jgi:hypothetical protein
VQNACETVWAQRSKLGDQYVAGVAQWQSRSFPSSGNSPFPATFVVKGELNSHSEIKHLPAGCKKVVPLLRRRPNSDLALLGTPASGRESWLTECLLWTQSSIMAAAAPSAILFVARLEHTREWTSKAARTGRPGRF